MILVDTAVWIDNFRDAEVTLVQHLETDGVGCHPLIIEELALESIWPPNTARSCISLSNTNSGDAD